MKKLILQLSDKAEELNANSKELQKLMSKIKSTSHAPTSEKHTKRMAPFAKDPKIVALVNNVLKSYFIKENQFVVKSDSHASHDIIETWYLFTLLLYSPKVEETVDFMLDSMIDDRNSYLSIARRVLNFCKNPVYNKHLKKVEAFFVKQNKTTKVYQWMDELGVIPPAIFNWEFSIQLRTAIVPSIDSKIENELSLFISANEPKGDGESFRIELRDRNREVDMRWEDFSVENSIRFKGKVLKLSVIPSIDNLRILIPEIEELFGQKFDRKYAFQYFTRGFKNKGNIQKWFLMDA
ncbi:MAG: hypothetical protein GQ574_14900 [Crocinitomix sp.]|nr:hypothetical protein [Crocinitomix sp.]